MGLREWFGRASAKTGANEGKGAKAAKAPAHGQDEAFGDMPYQPGVTDYKDLPKSREGWSEKTLRAHM